MRVIKFFKNLLVMLVFLGILVPVASAAKKHHRYNQGASKVFASDRSPYRLKRKKSRNRIVQNSGRRISPSAALRAAQRTSPGSRGLGVRYIRGSKGYIVKLKTRGGVLRVFVDARTGRVRR